MRESLSEKIDALMQEAIDTVEVIHIEAINTKNSSASIGKRNDVCLLHKENSHRNVSSVASTLRNV